MPITLHIPEQKFTLDSEGFGKIKFKVSQVEPEAIPEVSPETSEVITPEVIVPDTIPVQDVKDAEIVPEVAEASIE